MEARSKEKGKHHNFSTKVTIFGRMISWNNLYYFSNKKNAKLLLLSCLLLLYLWLANNVSWIKPKQMKSCCPEMSWGRLVEPSMIITTSNLASTPGAATVRLLLGKQLLIGEERKTPVYYSSPSITSSSSKKVDDSSSLSSSKKKAIVIIPDVWGPSDRLRRLADTFSQSGYHAIIPDSFRGETVDSHPNFVEWAGKFTFEDVVKKDLEAVLNYLHIEGNVSPKDDNIAIIGFCWGGWVIAKSASEGFPWKCGVSMHPATKLESFVFHRDETAMMGKINMPFLLLPAGNDEENLKPGSPVVEKLREKGGDSIVFERMVHGWVSRGDIGQPDVREDIDKALDLTVKFIEKNFSS